MGRRSMAPSTPAQVRATVAKHFRHLMGPERGGMSRSLLKLAEPAASDRDATLRRFAVQERV